MTEPLADWRDLMRLFLVRRTRGFIKDNYAKLDDATGHKYLTFETGERFYFPDRIPKTARFDFNEKDPNDPYAAYWRLLILFEQGKDDFIENIDDMCIHYDGGRVAANESLIAEITAWIAEND